MMAMLKTKELMEKYRIGSQGTMLELLRAKGSPAIMVGNKWMCDENEFMEYLKKRSERYKS